MSGPGFAYDVLVIGAGYIGCSVAYHLAAAGLRTALLEQGEIGSGASRANYGNVQVQDAELDWSLPMTIAGLKSCQSLEDELDCSVGYRRMGSLLLIETPAQWEVVAARLPKLHAAGIRAEIVPAERLAEIEPLLDATGACGGRALGACYHEEEGQVWPFALMQAYVRRGCEHGLQVRRETAVTGFQVRARRLEGVSTNRGDYSSPVVILTTGAWTPALGRLLGREWESQHVHGQALVTETSPRRLRNHISSAAFFEAMHEDEGQDAASDNGAPAVLAVAQSGRGNFLLGEAGVITTSLGKRSTAAGQAAIAREALRFLPALAGLRVLRGWGAPVAFTADGLPLLGPVAGLPGLILATAFKSTVIVTPLVGRLIAQLVLGRQPELDLAPFSPDRRITRSQ